MRPPAVQSMFQAARAVGEQAASASSVELGSASSEANWTAASSRALVMSVTLRNSAMPRSIAIG